MPLQTRIQEHCGTFRSLCVRNASSLKDFDWHDTFTALTNMRAPYLHSLDVALCTNLAHPPDCDWDLLAAALQTVAPQLRLLRVAQLGPCHKPILHSLRALVAPQLRVLCLDLSGRKSLWPTALQAFFQGMAAPHLHTFRLGASAANLHSHDVYHIADGLRQLPLPRLQALGLDLSYNRLHQHGVVALAAGLQVLRVAELRELELNLSGTGATDLAVETLANVVAGLPLRTLETLSLDLSENGLGEGAARALAFRVLSLPLPSLRVLRLSLRFNDLQAGGALALGMALKHTMQTPALQTLELDLPHNALQEHGLVAVVEGVGVVASGGLRTLRLGLGGNAMSDALAQALGRGLGELLEGPLQALAVDLSFNGLTDAGLCRVAGAWGARAVRLRALELDFSGTEGGFGGVLGVLDALRGWSLPHLVTLGLAVDGGYVEKGALPALATRALPDMPRLRRLTLTLCGRGGAGAVFFKGHGATAPHSAPCEDDVGDWVAHAFAVWLRGAAAGAGAGGAHAGVAVGSVVGAWPGGSVEQPVAVMLLGRVVFSDGLEDQFRACWRRCSAEGCDNVGLKRCSACGRVQYCGTACQRRHWPQHKPLCLRMRHWSHDIVELRPLPGPSAVPCISEPLGRRLWPQTSGRLRPPFGVNDFEPFAVKVQMGPDLLISDFTGDVCLGLWRHHPRFEDVVQKVAEVGVFGMQAYFRAQVTDTGRLQLLLDKHCMPRAW